mmetsp:Transcript_77083/g.160447  ORF Transcript_77083/g.160447 Transcript_77083/m.160447 type:complete len:482 (+) Transcript_77083:57-1502(+)|eukprot:CAMPEP_0206449030 /NCGR_PEP_ID=MMETSP0324_2-20121206/17845_1 /ASSEMBLY_ACC=CAM_ASM_000836 /TAXON_ID=2866 /ORGANISM="Crypthecodinium cohnii, Strain Seligo" /LENGTH=481 /DNA_ID=CAMNT_0053918327 /DNA_START=58 /DNA_END=1503 /DNA_ORIENTATION=-
MQCRTSDLGEDTVSLIDDPDAEAKARPKLWMVAGVGAVSAGLAVAGFLAVHPPQPAAHAAPVADSRGLLTAEDGPYWGCGLVGALPGISANGVADAETQRLIDGMKTSSSFNKVTYWNWNLAPESTDGSPQYLTKDFIFMPEQWGAGVVTGDWVRTANQANFLDSNGKPSPATMADIFLGSNEPDIYGSCMGNMFGECGKPCSEASVKANDCPAAYLESDVRAHANAAGECNCWQYSHATGVGFWPLPGCNGEQPLPKMWDDPGCVEAVMGNWKQTAAIAVSKGYKYLSTPLVAENMEYVANFVEEACKECQDISCGCTQYVGFHFYGYDCQPVSEGSYDAFQSRMDAVKELMERYPFVKGAIVNEVGMLNCAGEIDNPICIPDSGKYPAKNDPNHRCPVNSELPNGLATFVEHIMKMVAETKTSDGRGVVKGFSWFNENMAGGTYNLRLFDDDGSVNEVGEAYMKGCTAWGAAQNRQVQV